MKKLIPILILLMFTSLPSLASHPYPEKYYQQNWCSKWRGTLEYKLPDKTRIDCLTKNYAVEFDFAPKWAEAIGQSLHYAYLTSKNPAIVLILEKPSDYKYYNKIKPLCKKYDITLWYMKSPSYASESAESSVDNSTQVIVSYADLEKLLKTYYKAFKSTAAKFLYSI